MQLFHWWVNDVMIMFPFPDTVNPAEWRPSISGAEGRSEGASRRQLPQGPLYRLRVPSTWRCTCVTERMDLFSEMPQQLYYSMVILSVKHFLTQWNPYATENGEVQVSHQDMHNLSHFAGLASVNHVHFTPLRDHLACNTNVRKGLLGKWSFWKGFTA